MHTAITRFLRYLRVERNASELTVKSYREDLTALADYLSEARGGPCPEPGSLDVLELRGYVAALHEAGYAKSTVARRLASLRSFFRFGQRDGWAKGNPAKPLRNPRRGRTLPHFLSAEEIGRLLWSPPADRPMGLRDRAILETMYSAGLRVSEVVGLEQGDLDLEAGILRVRGKGRRERLAPIGSYAVRALQALAGGAAAPSTAACRPAIAGVRQQVRPPAHDAERGADAGKVPPPDRPGRPHHPAFPAAQFRHPPLGPRRRHPQRAGAAGA